MRDADAKADAGAHGGFALLDYGGDGVVVLGLDLAGGHQVIDQLIMASQRFAACRSVMICSMLRMSPKSIAVGISPLASFRLNPDLHFKWIFFVLLQNRRPARPGPVLGPLKTALPADETPRRCLEATSPSAVTPGPRGAASRGMPNSNTLTLPRKITTAENK